jgi:iron complex outermembrane receptor protein
LQNPEEQKSFIGRFTRLIGENAEFTAEYLWADSTISSGIAPTTFSNLPITPDSPYFPGAGLIPAIPGLDPTLPAGVSSRWAPGGRRTTLNDSTTDRILLQVSGDSGAYDYEVYGLHSSGEASLSMLDGAYHIPEFDGGFAGTSGVFLNPFGEQSDEANAFLDSIRVTGELVNAQSTLKIVGATLGRDLWNLDAGPVTAAIAIEYGEEDVDYYRDPIANELRGGVVGGNQSVDGKRDQYSITGEVLIPVTDRFEINASVRYDDYSDFGDTTNPKILLSYDASDRVNIHGSYNTGFRAPTLFNIVTPSTLSFIVGNPYDDPVLCPGGVVNTSAGGIDIRDCGVRYNRQIGGNKNLEPEESEAFAVGVDVQATDSFQFSIDYWDYDLDNKIGPLSHPAIFANPDRFASLLVRCSQADPVLAAGSNTCNFGGGGDPIAYVIQTNTNLGKTMTSGFDLTANWFADTSIGLVGIDYRATYVRDYDFERVPGDPTFSRAGQYFDGFPVPEYVHYLAFNWQNGNWSGQLQNQFVKGYSDCNGQCGIAPEYFNEVGDYSPFNLTASYAFSEALSIALHIKNLFDEDPPFTNGGPLCATCDPRFTDPTGRAVGVTVRGTFDY